MAQRVGIITGGSSGIGLNAAKKLVKQGYHIIIASRNVENTNKAVNEIKKETGKDTIEGMHLDLCLLESVRRFVDEFKQKNLPLHLLVNNAGVMQSSKT